MKKRFLIYIFLFVSSVATAQLYEIGLFAGGSNYIGDVGRTNYIYPNFPAGGGVLKYNYTPRINFRGTVNYTKLIGDDTKSNEEFRKDRGIYFEQKIADGTIGVEFNFFKYSMNKIGFSHTPYIIVEAGLAYYGGAKGTKVVNGNLTTDVKRQIIPILPFGLGYKTRLAENFSIALEARFRYTFKDNIDNNNYEVENLSFGNPNSDDWYVFTGFTITYGFGRPGCYKGYF